jgi:transcription elongation factor Elf1
MAKSKKIEVVINRATWRTGGNSNKRTGKGDTRLLNDEGYMCCLGFISSCYLKTKKKNSKKTILNAYEPQCLNCLIPELNNKMDEYDQFFDTQLSDRAMKINDDIKLKPETKEKKIKELFKNSMYKLKFVGEFTKPETN